MEIKPVRNIYLVLAGLYAGFGISSNVAPFTYLLMANSMLAFVWLMSTYENNTRSRPAAWVNVWLAAVAVLMLPLDYSTPAVQTWSIFSLVGLALCTGYAARKVRR